MFNLNSILATLITLSSGLFTYYVIQIIQLRKKYKHIPGPDDNGLVGFFFGNFFEIIKNKRENKLFSDLIVNWIEKHGKTVKYRIFNKVLVSTIDLQANKVFTHFLIFVFLILLIFCLILFDQDILIDRNFPKDTITYTQFGYPYGQRWLGNGLVTEIDATKWKHKRSLYNPVFHKQYV